MNKREVAEYLNLSTRAVERAVEHGKLGVQYRKERYGNTAVFDMAEVRKYKAQIHVPRPKTALAGSASPVDDNQKPELVMGKAISFSEGSPEAGNIPVTSKLTLSIAEASGLSGLSDDFLINAIKDGRLKAFEADGSWRVKRADLDCFIRDL